MPPARSQEVTVRHPRAKRIPASTKGNRTAVRLSSQWAKEKKTLVRAVGKQENVMVGSSR